MDKRIRFYIYWILGLVFLGACAPGDEEDVYTEMRAFEDFSRINGDSVAIVPRKVRLKALQKMEEAKDSLVKYNYLAMTLKTYLITSQLDSAQIVIQQIHDFIERQHSSSQMADFEGGVFGKDKAVILYVVHFRQPGALFPKLHEDVEHNFLRPLFVLHEIAGNTEQTVVAQIVETVKSPFRVFFLHLAQVASDFLFGHAVSRFCC